MFEMFLTRSERFEMSRLWPNSLWPVDPHNDHFYDPVQDLYGLDLVFHTIFFSILMTLENYWGLLQIVMFKTMNLKYMLNWLLRPPTSLNIAW